VEQNSVYVQRTSPFSLKADIDRSLFAFNVYQKLIPDKLTLVKINGNFDKIYPGSNTSSWFLDGLFHCLKNRGFNKLGVIEGDLPTFRATKMIQNTGLISILKKYGVRFIPHEHLLHDEHELPIILREAQLINVPVFHTHGIAIISCATKNLFGLLPKSRRKYHKILPEKLVELAQRIESLTIVDGTVGLDSESTRRGSPRRLDLILGGWNCLTIDAVVAQIMGFSLSEIPHLALARRRGLLPSAIEIRGEFSLRNLPRYNFRFKLSALRKAAMGFEATFLGSIPPVLWIEDRLRRLYHNYSYYKKRPNLFNGPWREYEQ